VCPNTTVRFQRCTRRCYAMYLVVTSAAFRTSSYLEMHPPPRQKELYLQSDDVVFKHRHGSHCNGLFPGNNTESYDPKVVEDEVPLLENPSDSFLNDILHRKRSYNWKEAHYSGKPNESTSKKMKLEFCFFAPRLPCLNFWYSLAL